MIKVMSLASVMLFSSVAIAGYGGFSNVVESETMRGEVVSTKAAAVKEGQEIVGGLSSLSSYELSTNVNYPNHDQIDYSSFELLESNIKVEEVISEDGNVAYKPVVNMKYQFSARDRRRD